MADIVLGIGSSHGPLLSTPPEQWDLRAKADRENKSHWFRGKTYDYRVAAARSARPASRTKSSVEKRRERFMQCRARWRRSARSSTRSRPTPSSSSATISASSSTAGLTPAITVYRGSQISNVQHLHEDPPGLNIAEPATRRRKARPIPARPSSPTTSSIARRRELRPGAVGADAAAARPRGGIPHAYGFFYHTILQDTTPPSVPIILNVHFPHNTPKTAALPRARPRALSRDQELHRLQARGADGVGRADPLRHRRGARSAGDDGDADRRRGRAREAARELLQGRHGGDQELVSRSSPR